MVIDIINDIGKNLKKYLSHFAHQIEFIEDEKVNKHGYRYVGIEFIANELIAKEILNGINKELNEQNGKQLILTMQKHGEDYPGNKYLYEALLTPREHLGENAYKDLLKGEMPGIGKAIKNIIYNHASCKEKVREIRDKR